jgi:hypothetical protein
MHSKEHLDPAFQSRKCVLHIRMWCILFTYTFDMQSTHRMRMTTQHTVAQSVIQHLNNGVPLAEDHAEVKVAFHAIAECMVKSMLTFMP